MLSVMYLFDVVASRFASLTVHFSFLFLTAVYVSSVLELTALSIILPRLRGAIGRYIYKNE